MFGKPAGFSVHTCINWNCSKKSRSYFRVVCSTGPAGSEEKSNAYEKSQKLREPLSILIKYETIDTLKIDKKLKIYFDVPSKL